MCVVRTAILIVLCVFVIPVVVVDSAKVRHHSTGRQALKFVKNRGGIGATFGQGTATGNAGLWPNVFNVATKAVITVNATCGKEGREEFCRLSEGARGRCGICDNSSTDPGKRHPIHFAIDVTNKWWQSPALYYGPEYEFVTITLDLKQIYQVAYIIIKAANSPRPGSWILERSLDGKSYHPWQYFATNDKECVEKYGTPATKGKPHYATDTEVICTTYYSRLSPMENGEIHTWLVHGRPGANETSPELLEFTKARYVRLRFQGFRGSIEPIPKWLSQDILKDKRLFYSIRDISIGGQCVCNGHAANCRHNVASGHPECECAHHTCGPNCDRCCPLYNQRKWGAGSSRDSRHCLACNCHGHADSCHYDASTDRDGLSIDANGNYKGGGVCENCTAHTTGTNCERCITGYYRPYGRTPDSEIPCVKCSCDPLGSTGICSVGADGPLCECRPGYGGTLCDACAPGYRGYPNCEICPCDDRGVVPNNDCEQDCRCKVNVEGQLCDRCKPGHFALHKTNREGCYACFCSRVTTLCETAAVIQRTFETLDEWYVSDISATHLEKPTLDERNMLSIGNYEIPGIESYYWLAPKSYLGNKLEIYASNFVFKIHWVVMRGDTSGKPTTGPNLIMVGANGMRIAHGKDFYTGTNMTFTIPLLEDGWSHIIEDKDIATRLRRDDYEGDSVTRSQFLSVLTDVKHVMLRAKFHADQIEVSLEQAVLKVGEDGDGYGAVERCSCPSGYTGLSCETCDYGYVRVNTNTTDHHEQGFCVKCDCNGHSKTCDADTAQCFCEHNTVGETCNRCVPGFYGNALIGTPDDCRQCACPLIEEENNFSPSCQLDSLSLSNDDDEPGYVCTQCPKGYTGDHCEICDDGYFGLPTKPGGTCQPCSCSGNPCDRITGQCLGCKGNTEGWKCERCKSGYFGDPTTSNCQACLCDSFGSMSDECDNTTGQCVCKDKVIGRTCDRCMDRFGNMTASCTPCDCNTIGSRSDICDPRTGLCDCQPGIEGFHCDACQHLHFGFGESGCQSCNCNSRGSEIPTCDIKSGNCRCKPNYIGRTCDQCEGGYWESSTGCVKCQCDSDGSTSINCDRNSGYCNCKPGVGGEHCDNCLPGYYNFTNTGCTQCKECRKPNHICDPDTGDCVCPRHSCGTKCTKCCPYSWGYKPYVGCEPCACSQEGSTSQQCDVTKGTCHCRLGYAGDKCNRCAHGYYGYPKCRRCNCNLSGTDRNQARCDVNGVCQCNDDGSCVCKENVQNRNCNECKDGTFGLHVDNPSGCTPCFCFGRSTICKDAQLTWGQIRTNSTRELDVSNTPNGRTVISGDTIKGRYGNVTVSPAELEDWRRRNLPLYWRLHEVFKGDRILSYSGYIRFMTETFGSNYPPQRSERYPLVKLFGNGITLHYYPSMPPPIGRHEVRFHESLWQDGSGNKKVHRGILMMVLQNVTDIHIKATDSSNFNKLIIHEVTLDTAIEVKGTPPPLAIGVEICECPPQYNSSSCQDPSIGHYRDRTKQVTQTAIFDKVVGKAEPCRCNGRSKICDIESGRCLNCANSTSGQHCEKCAEGFYGNPMIAYGSCKPCPCPTPEHNFALGCLPGQPITCYCKPGYEGPKCNKCSKGYYGHPSEVGGSCMPCDCNRGGIVADKCDSSTGQCECKRGITGRQCSKCEKARHILENNACIPCDDCAQKLLDQIDQLSKWLHGNTSHLLDGKIEPPWHQLTNMEDRFVRQHERYKKFDDDAQKAKKLIDKANLHHQEDKLGKLGKKFEKTKMKLDAVQKNGNEMAKKAVETLVEMEEVNANVQTLLEMLSDFGKSHVSVKEAVQEGTDLLKLLEEKSNAIKKMQNRNNVLKKCQEIRDFLENVNSKRLDGQADDLEEELKKANEFLDDLEKILAKINVKLADTKAKNLNNMNRIVALAGKIEKLKIDTDIVGKESERKNKILNETAAILNSTQSIFNTLKNDADFKKLLKMLHNKEKYMEKNLPTLEKHLAKVTDHASQLNKNIAKYMQMLSLDEKELSAVNASKAYSNVIELLEEANMVADDADQQLRNTKLIILPNDADSIFVNTTICDADSKRLEARINMIKNKIPDYDEKYMGLQLKMEKLKNQNWDNGMNNTGQSKRLQEIKDELSNEIDTKKLIREAIAHSEKMKNVYRTAMEINISTQYDLARTFQKHLNLTSQNKIEMLRNQIKLTKELLQNTFVHNQTNLDLIKAHNRNFSNFYVKNSSISAKLDELRAKIQKSKEIADGIRVSLSGPNCSRSYRLNDLEPTLITNLTVTFEYMNPKKPTSLFYLSNDKKQYMNLKIADGLISFQVSLSGSVVELSHPTPLRENTYYNVNVERISHNIKMSVDNSFVEKEIGSTVFKTNPSDLIKMGGAPQALGLPGCVREVIFNRRAIGFWNFETSAGSCFGCIRNNTNIINDANPNSIFNGAGYSLIHKQRQDKSVKPDKIRVSFEMRTFDENALLFLAPHPEGGTYMAVTLNQGHIQFTMHYKKAEPIILKTKERYNNGKSIDIEIVKVYDKGKKMDEAILVVEKETTNGTREVTIKEILKVKQVYYYFGGVPPDFLINSKDVTASLNTHQSLLGIISNCNADQLFTLHETTNYQQHYGVEKSDGDSEFRKVWFEGQGHLTLKTTKLVPDYSIAFLIRTNQSSAFVMDVENVATFSVQSGKIAVSVIHKKKKISLSSASAIDDDDYHLIELVFKSNLTLSVDGVEEHVEKIKSAKASVGNEEQMVYMGGLDNSDEARFNGEISDIIVDGRLVKFNAETVINFEKAKIGRGLSTKKKRAAPDQKDENENLLRVTNDNIKDMQRTEGCDMAINPYVLEPNAVKFGDRPESYVKYNWKELLWKEDFSLEFEFRTFYKAGMLLFAQGETMKEHYNLIDVKEGKIVVIVAGRRKKIFEPAKKVDDGEWHKIVIVIKTNKKKRRLTVIVDDKKEKAKKIPLNKVSGDVFVGGLPKDVQHKMPKSSKLQPFRGCVRGLKLNGEQQGFQNHHKINVCFPKIEKGSYFNGDAHAIYDRNFRVQEHLEFNFEFRTAEQNGILLSVSTPNNNPALSVELQNGAVVMSVDMGNGVVSNVTNYLSEYALCNNRWHNVTALFSSELTVNVDGVSKSWVISEGGFMDDIDDPLYIGGLPDTAPEGTLKTRENFKGCIRNVKIGNSKTDWVDMAELNNVSLNSCPIV